MNWSAILTIKTKWLLFIGNKHLGISDEDKKRIPMKSTSR